MIHLYALVRDLTALPSAHGLAAAPLERVDIDGIVAIVSLHESSELGETRDLALAHGRVVTALDASGDVVLPVRFGERFGNVEELRAAVRERRLALNEGFERVRGSAEIRLRVLDAERGEPPPPASGTDYMRRLHAAVASSQPADELHRRLQSLSRAVRVTSRVGERHSASYLVPRDELDEVRQVVQKWTAEHPDVPVICTGPWAPFSFVAEAV